MVVMVERRTDYRVVQMVQMVNINKVFSHGTPARGI